MQVKRPAYGGEGLVVDHYNRAAAARFLDSVVGPVIQAGQGNVETIFCDSLEVYNANWTHDFPQEFRKRRGYDLIPLLPNLFDNASELRFDLRFDFWRTLAELTEARFTQVLGAWSKRHNTRLEMEAYGTPPNPLTAARYIDVPTGEQYEWQGFSMSRLAASGAHLTGKKIIGTEAWTWSGIPNRLGDSLLDLKRLSDIHFLAGMNELTGVDFPYSPRAIGAPGWQPYYGPTMNQNNPQWPYFHSLVEYINRCQWMLRQGKPVADVAIYLPVEDKLAHGPVEQQILDFHLRDHFVTGETTGEFGLTNSFRHHSELIHTLLTNGMNYDGIDFWTINRLAKVRKGKLICGDGEYSIVILPNLEGIDLAALKKLAEFVRQGGLLIATKRLPSRVFGLNQAAATRKLAILIETIFGGPQADVEHRSHTYGRGKAHLIPRLDVDIPHGILMDIISDDHAGDFDCAPSQNEIGYVHRKTAWADIYFITNLSDRPKEFRAYFPDAYEWNYDKSHATRWPTEFDPMSGSLTNLYPFGLEGQGQPSAVPMRLEAYASTFIVFGNRLDVETMNIVPTSNALSFHPISQNLVWSVSFNGPDAPKSRTIKELVPWTAWPDTKYFSGQGIYSTEFEWKDSLPAKCLLRFEQVKEAGEVWINGKSAGVVWMPPYQVDIAKLLKPGTNTLKVTVGNLPVNRFLGLPDEDLKPLRAVYGNRFPTPQEKQVMPNSAPSGLIGKVWLITEGERH